eukprot:1148293-Pelagomonas_calceolata.AAC.4
MCLQYLSTGTVCRQREHSLLQLRRRHTCSKEPCARQVMLLSAFYRKEAARTEEQTGVHVRDGYYKECKRGHECRQGRAFRPTQKCSKV